MITKTIIRKLFIGTVMCLMLTTYVYAQSNVNDAYITMDSISPGTFAGTYMVILSDTTFDQLEIKLGTSSNGSQLLNHTFDYDVTTGLPAYWTYSRNGNTVTLGVGTYSEQNIYFGSVRVKSQNEWSSYYNFITN